MSENYCMMFTIILYSIDKTVLSLDWKAGYIFLNVHISVILGFYISLNKYLIFPLDQSVRPIHQLLIIRLAAECKGPQNSTQCYILAVCFKCLFTLTQVHYLFFNITFVFVFMNLLINYNIMQFCKKLKAVYYLK